MGIQRIWVGTGGTTSGDYGDDKNWSPINYRSATYRWTASGSGTAEYYCELAAGGNPGIDEPGHVNINGSAATKATLGSLAAGNYGFGDNDGLGFSTIYVRLSDGTDPDTKASGYITGTDFPNAGDSVSIPSGSYSITTGLDQRSVAITAFVVEKGYSGAIASRTGYLLIDPDTVDFNGSGVSYIDVGDNAVSVTVRGTSSAVSGDSAFFLTGGSLTEVLCESGKTKIVSSTVTELIVQSGAEARTDGTDITTITNLGGTVYHAGSINSVLNSGSGTTTIDGTGVVTDITATGGTIVCNTTGTVTTATAQGGSLDFSQSRKARTVTTLKVNAGSAKYDPDILTITNAVESSGVLTLEAA